MTEPEQIESAYELANPQTEQAESEQPEYTGSFEFVPYSPGVYNRIMLRYNSNTNSSNSSNSTNEPNVNTNQYLFDSDSKIIQN